MEKKIVKKIDIHAHASVSGWPSFAPTVPMVTPEQLIGIYDQLGVEKGVLLPLLTNIVFQPNSNYEIQQIAEKYPDRFEWFCIFDPWQLKNSPDTDFMPFLEFCKSKGAKGVGEVCANIPFDDPRMENLMRQCEAANLPFTIHIGLEGGEYGIADEKIGLPRLEKALQKFPNLRILGHSQRFWYEISKYEYQDPDYNFNRGKVIPGGRVVELMRKYPNLLGDLSAGSGYNAMTRDPEFTYAFMEEFADRLYYGIDICRVENIDNPMVRLAAFLDNAMLEGKISYDTYYKICRGNAEKLLGLV